MNIFGLGLPELIVIALILLLFFGPKRLPGLFRSIGTSVRELKKGLSEDTPETEEHAKAGTVNTEKKDDATQQN